MSTPLRTPFQFSANSIPNSKFDESTRGPRSSPQPPSQRSTSSPFQFTPNDFREGSPNPFEYRPGTTELSSHQRAPSLNFQSTLDDAQDNSKRLSPSPRNSPRPSRSRSPAHRTSRSVGDASIAFKSSGSTFTSESSMMNTTTPQNSFQKSPSLSPFSADVLNNPFASLDISRGERARSSTPSRSSPRIPFGRSSLSPSRSPATGWSPSLPRASPAYDPAAELMPSHKYFFQDFQSWLGRGKALASDIAREVEVYKELDVDQATRLRTIAKQLATMGTGVTRSVAILGDSGTGKPPAPLVYFLC